MVMLEAVVQTSASGIQTQHAKQREREREREGWGNESGEQGAPGAPLIVEGGWPGNEMGSVRIAAAWAWGKRRHGAGHGCAVVPRDDVAQCGLRNGQRQVRAGEKPTHGRGDGMGKGMRGRR